ncbi:MAG: hypothetical protein RLY16_179 [Bacteroidota bacterium]|jgi:uncharacterized protein
MKIILTIFFVLTTAILVAQNTAQNTTFNAQLADSLKADDYGMRMYSLVILKTGKRDEKNPKVLDSLFKGHMANITKMAKSGELFVAGPIEKNSNQYRGIFILKARTEAETRAFLQADPAIAAGIFEIEIYDWYGSAALPLYLPYHDQIQKTKF